MRDKGLISKYRKLLKLRKQPNLKMGERSEKKAHRRYIGGKLAYEKMLNIMSLGNGKLKQRDAIHYTPIRMAKIQNINTTKCWQGGCGATGTLIYCWWEGKMVQTLWKTI